MMCGGLTQKGGSLGQKAEHQPCRRGDGYAALLLEEAGADD